MPANIKGRLRKARSLVVKVLELSGSFKAMSRDALVAEYRALKKNYSENDDRSEETIVRVLSIAREAATRVLGLEAYSEQLIAAYMLHFGAIAEMATGEGKTLSAAFCAVLQNVTGKSTHIFTPNAYLAERDHQDMLPLFDFMGISCGYLTRKADFEQRSTLYRKCDVLYVAGTELAYDYMRNHVVNDPKRVHPICFDFAIIDEADLMLIDEARLPLGLSGGADISAKDHYTHAYEVLKRVLEKNTVSEDPLYTVNDKSRQAYFTDEGFEYIESLLKVKNLYSDESLHFVHYLQQALLASVFYKRDHDYVVKDGKVISIDQRTGRLVPGRSWGSGLQQSIEIKEGVELSPEQLRLGSITVQNFFRCYKKLSGMTGTASSDKEEYEKVYGLSIAKIPRHCPSKRDDLPDRVYLTSEERYLAVVEDVQDRHQKGQPILIGTVSVDASERISALLNDAGIPHELLNAKDHSREAEIIGNAGAYKAVTVATNMAGRGTDIKLGGKEQERYQLVSSLGGLYVIGLERQELRRLDDQLIGRSGRQGDNGQTCFYLSLEDNLMKIFGSEQVANALGKIESIKGKPLSNKALTKVIKEAQSQIDRYYLNIRSQLMEYDEIYAKQCQVYYQQRQVALASSNMVPLIGGFVGVEIDKILKVAGSQDPSFSEFKELVSSNIQERFGFIPHIAGDENLFFALKEQAMTFLLAKAKGVVSHQFNGLVRKIVLASMDKVWRQHMNTVDYLKESLGLKVYGEKNLKERYRRDAHDSFIQFSNRVRKLVLDQLFLGEGGESRSMAA